MAEETHNQRIKLVQEIIAKRVKEDVNFAKDVLQAVGDNLPPDIKKAAEDKIAGSNNNSIEGEEYPETEIFMETDGGDPIPVPETSDPDYPRDI
jgi:hypothetical protein